MVTAYNQIKGQTKKARIYLATTKTENLFDKGSFQNHILSKNAKKW